MKNFVAKGIITGKYRMPVGIEASDFDSKNYTAATSNSGRR